MRWVPTLIAICGVAAIALVNTELFMPHYKGVQHAVGHDVASVYTPHGSDSPLVPVESDSNDTGQRVHVYIKNSYRDDDIRRSHTLTITVLVTSVALYGLARLVCSWRYRVNASNHAMERTPDRP
jgi:hypothetical protein